MDSAPARSTWPAAAAELTAATAVALLAAGLLLRAWKDDIIFAALVFGPLIGAAVGTRAGWSLGRKGKLLPVCLFAGLAIASYATTPGVYQDVGLLFTGITVVPFSVVGVAFGGWLLRALRTDPRAGRPVHLYNHVVSAFIVAGIVSSVVSDHAESLLPAWLAAPGGGSAYPSWLKTAALLWLLACLCAASLWVRPIQLALAGGREDLLGTARLRAERLYAFLVGAAVLLALPDLVAGLPYAWAVRGGPDWRILLAAALSAYYAAYVLILYFEPYLYAEVMPRLYSGAESLALKRGATLSVRLKLWLMVLNLVLIPMALVLASLLQHREALGSLWPTPAAIVIVAIACVIGYCEVLYGSVTKPLDELGRRMRLVSEGDFSVRAPVLGDDEIGVIQSHFNRMVDGLEERERLRDTFGRYVSVEIARKLLDDRRVDLGGESIEATILFSDIRGFTPMSERMPPGALVDFLNAYFAHVTEPVMAHRGVINKFIGDAVMAVFAPQFGSERHAEDAVLAALGMREALAAFNATRPGEPPVEFGVGIHTGTLVAGNIGTKARLEYTLIGDTVNVASRIESSNKRLGSTILLSAAVRDALRPETLDRVPLERCEAVRLKGKSADTVLYKVL